MCMTSSHNLHVDCFCAKGDWKMISFSWYFHKVWCLFMIFKIHEAWYLLVILKVCCQFYGILKNQEDKLSRDKLSTNAFFTSTSISDPIWKVQCSFINTLNSKIICINFYVTIISSSFLSLLRILFNLSSCTCFFPLFSLRA